MNDNQRDNSVHKYWNNWNEASACKRKSTVSHTLDLFAEFEERNNEQPTIYMPLCRNIQCVYLKMRLYFNAPRVYYWINTNTHWREAVNRMYCETVRYSVVCILYLYVYFHFLLSLSLFSVRRCSSIHFTVSNVHFTIFVHFRPFSLRKLNIQWNTIASIAMLNKQKQEQ